MRKVAVGVLAFTSGIVLTGAALQPASMPKLDTYVAQVYEQLRGYQEELDLGAMTHEIHTSSLTEGRSVSVNVQLDADNDYAFLGVCDNDCSDLDLRIYDSLGKLVDEDIEADDYPVLLLSANRAGTYRVEVVMAACSSDPCRFGVAAYDENE